jgi:hypothetical protein
VSEIGITTVARIAHEMCSLKGSLLQAELAGDAALSEAVTELIHDRLADLANAIVDASACTTADLALKATVLLDWLDPDRSDIPVLLSASLCRDIVLLFAPAACTAEVQ